MTRLSAWSLAVEGNIGWDDFSMKFNERWTLEISLGATSLVFCALLTFCTFWIGHAALKDIKNAAKHSKSQ